MHAMLRRILSLLRVRLRRIAPVLGSQAAREIIDEAGDVIVEAATGKARAGCELRVAAHGLPPEVQQMVPPLFQVGG
jgi:hypothetical protein